MKLAPDTICVHADNPEAVMLAKKIRQVLYASGIEIASARRFYNRE
ncbi:MAG: LamB/YcsF family protein [Thermodesulfobacteriota bacterium]